MLIPTILFSVRELPQIYLTGFVDPFKTELNTFIRNYDRNSKYRFPTILTCVYRTSSLDYLLHSTAKINRRRWIKSRHSARLTIVSTNYLCDRFFKARMKNIYRWSSREWSNYVLCKLKSFVRRSVIRNIPIGPCNSNKFYALCTTTNAMPYSQSVSFCNENARSM